MTHHPKVESWIFPGLSDFGSAQVVVVEVPEVFSLVFSFASVFVFGVGVGVGGEGETRQARCLAMSGGIEWVERMCRRVEGC